MLPLAIFLPYVYWFYSSAFAEMLNEALAMDVVAPVLVLPLVYFFWLYDNRRELYELAKEGFSSFRELDLAAGAFLMLLSAFLYVFGSLSVFELELKVLSFVFCLTGFLAMFYGAKLVERMWLPLASTVFLVPIPVSSLQWIMGSLSLATGKLSYYFLKALGFPIEYVECEGVCQLILAKDGSSVSLMVAAQCAGFYTISALLMIGILVAGMVKAKLRERLAILAFSVVLGFLLNALRVSVLAAVAWSYGLEAMDAVHTYLGAAFLILSPFLLIEASEKLLRVKFRKPEAPKLALKVPAVKLNARKAMVIALCLLFLASLMQLSSVKALAFYEKQGEGILLVKNGEELFPFPERLNFSEGFFKFAYSQGPVQSELPYLRLTWYTITYVGPYKMTMVGQVRFDVADPGYRPLHGVDVWSICMRSIGFVPDLEQTDVLTVEGHSQPVKYFVLRSELTGELRAVSCFMVDVDYAYEGGTYPTEMRVSLIFFPPALKSSGLLPDLSSYARLVEFMREVTEALLSYWFSGVEASTFLNARIANQASAMSLGASVAYLAYGLGRREERGGA